MELVNAELLPGIIIQNEDPEELCRIKALVPKYFDESMEEENLPWICPLTAGGESFSIPETGKKVWVLINKANYMEYWYFPFFQPSSNSATLYNAKSNTSSLLYKDNATYNTDIHYSNDDGLNISNGDNKLVLGNPCEPVTLKDNNNKGLTIDAISTNGTAIQLGDINGLGYTLVKAEALNNIFGRMAMTFEKLASESENNPFIVNLAESFTELSSMLTNVTEDISTKNTYAN